MMSKQLQVYAVISMNHQQLKAVQSSLNRDLAKLNMTRTKETSMKTSTPKNKSKFLHILDLRRLASLIC